MPLYTELRKYVADQEDIVRSGGFERNPESRYLLGFEKEEVEALPIKTYIRRLWLAFHSGNGPMPKYFLDHMAEEFSKEISYWVSVFANDPIKLATELTKEAVDIVGAVDRERGFLEDVADIILIKRGWGDELWGHRKFCRAGLCNSKPEPGHDKAPKWPQDKDRISLAVRQWIAAQLQAKVQNPRDKNVPRVDCPTDPGQRRESIAAGYTELVREDSDGEDDVAPNEGPDGVGARSVMHIQIKEEGSSSPPPMRRMSTRATAGQSAALDGIRYSSASQAGLQTPAASSAHISPASVVAGRSSTSTRPSSKRKRNERTLSHKRPKTAARVNASRSQSSNPRREHSGRTPDSNVSLAAVPRKESNTADYEHLSTAAPLTSQRRSRHALSAGSRSLRTLSIVDRGQQDQVDRRESTADNLPPTPASQGGLTQISQGEECPASSTPSLGTSATVLGEHDSLNEDNATSQNARSALHCTGNANFGSASRTQVFDPTTLLASSSSSISLANANPMAVRSTCPPEESTMVKDTEDLGTVPNHKGKLGPTTLQVLPFMPSEKAHNQEQPSGEAEERNGGAHTSEQELQLKSTIREQDASCNAPKVSTDNYERRQMDKNIAEMGRKPDIHGRWIEALHSEREAMIADLEQATNASLTCTTHGKGSDFNKCEDPSANVKDSHSRVSSHSSYQSQSSPSVCQASVATESFLEQLQNERFGDMESYRPSTRAQNSKGVSSTPYADGATRHSQPRDGHDLPLETIPILDFALAGTKGRGMRRNVVVSIAMMPTSPTDKRIEDTSSQGSASSQEEMPLGTLPFPPGASLKPPRCSNCYHSLDKAIDVMRDSRGFAQWKKKCIFCRDRAGPRPLPCECHTCQPPSMEQETDGVSANATPSTGSDDDLRAERTYTPFVGQPFTPATGQTYAPPSGSSSMVNHAINFQLTPVGNAVKSLEARSRMQHGEVEELGRDSIEAATAEPSFSFEHWLDRDLDANPVGGSQNTPIDLTNSGVVQYQGYSGSSQPSRPGFAQNLIMTFPQQTTSALKAQAFIITPEHGLQSSASDQGSLENPRGDQLQPGHWRTSKLLDAFVPNNAPVDPWSIPSVLNGPHSGSPLSTSTNEMRQPLSTLSNCLEFERRMSVPQPSILPTTSPVAVAHPAFEGYHQPHTVPRIPIQSPLQPALFHHTPLNWESSRIDALMRMISSIECIFDGSLTIDYVLDHKIPKVERQYAHVMAGVREPDKSHSSKPMRALLQNSQTLCELRTSGFLPGSLSCRGASSGSCDNESDMLTKLERLNQRFISSVSSWSIAEITRKLALCHDLATLTSEMLREEPNILDHNLFLGLTQVYEKERLHLATAFGEETNLYSSMSNIVTSASPPTQPKDMRTLYQWVTIPSKK